MIYYMYVMYKDVLIQFGDSCFSPMLSSPLVNYMCFIMFVSYLPNTLKSV